MLFRSEESLVEMRKSGKTIFHEPTLEEQAAWRAALRQVHVEMADRVGSDLIKRIYEATGQTP